MGSGKDSGMRLGLGSILRRRVFGAEGPAGQTVKSASVLLSLRRLWGTVDGEGGDTGRARSQRASCFLGGSFGHRTSHDT